MRSKNRVASLIMILLIFFVYSVALALCLAILPVAPHVQAQFDSLGERLDQKGSDYGINPNMAFANYVDPVGGASVEELVQMALVRNAELLATHQRATEAQGLLLQAGFRPNPGFEVSVSNGRILNSPGEREITLSYAHTFELGGKRERRVEVAQVRAELARLEIADRERKLKADIKAKYGEALAAARNLETAEQLLGNGENERANAG